MGFDTTGIYIFQNRVIIEGDIGINVTDLDKTKTRQVTPQLVNEDWPIKH